MHSLREYHEVQQSTSRDPQCLSQNETSPGIQRVGKNNIYNRKKNHSGWTGDELMNSVHKNLRAWLYVCERALESKDVEESGMQIVAEHGGRHTIFKEETTPNGANWRSWTPENDGCREGTRKDACQKTQRENTEKHRGPVNSGTTSIYRQAVGSQGERRKQSGEITVKSSPAPNRIHKF